MPEKYTPSARAALMALMLENRAVPNPELANQLKVRMTPSDRAKLNEHELIESAKEGRSLVHRITDKGIEWCMTDLVVGSPPSRSGPLARMYAETLRRVVRYLQQRGTLAEAIRAGDLESLIRAVYFDLTVGPQDWVRLARVRPRLNGAEKGEVDETLVKMMKEGAIHLAPDSNRKMLTSDDHEAAIRIGNEDLHLMAIEES